MDDVKQKIEKVLADVLEGKAPLNLEEIDSIDFVDIMLTLEKEFMISFDHQEFGVFESISQLEDLIKKKI